MPQGPPNTGRGASSLVSLVVPALDERDTLPALYDEICAQLTSFGWELILVDDGSTDGTFDVICQLAERDPRVRGLKLSRRFGHQAALLAGLRDAQGAAVVSLDADLQHPPQVVVELVDAWRHGASIVHTQRQSSHDAGWFKRRLSAGYYRLFSFLSGVAIGEGESDFRLLDREVVDVVVGMQHARPFLRGLVHWVGYPQARVPYRARPRFAGRSKYGLLRMLRLGAAGVTSFSTIPLRLGILLGAATSTAAFLELAYILYVTVRGDPVPGWASLAGLVALLMGINFMLLGFVGTYVGHVFERIQGHPAYLVERRTPKPQTTDV